MRRGSLGDGGSRDAGPCIGVCWVEAFEVLGGRRGGCLGKGGSWSVVPVKTRVLGVRRTESWWRLQVQRRRGWDREVAANSKAHKQPRTAFQKGCEQPASSSHVTEKLTM